MKIAMNFHRNFHRRCGTKWKLLILVQPVISEYIEFKLTFFKPEFRRVDDLAEIAYLGAMFHVQHLMKENIADDVFGYFG